MRSLYQDRLGTNIGQALKTDHQNLSYPELGRPFPSRCIQQRQDKTRQDSECSGKERKRFSLWELSATPLKGYGSAVRCGDRYHSCAGPAHAERQVPEIKRRSAIKLSRTEARRGGSQHRSALRSPCPAGSTSSRLPCGTPPPNSMTQSNGRNGQVRNGLDVNGKALLA